MIDYILENSIKSMVFWAVGIFLIGLVWWGHSVLTTNFPTVSPSRYQAVFLSNNQVYFGKLQSVTDSYVTLSNVYYLRSSSDLDASKDSTGLNLIKLGGELHGPEDPIYIPKSSVLFWENMKNSSRVVQTILTAQK